MTRETVLIDTRACAATSRIVAVGIDDILIPHTEAVREQWVVLRIVTVERSLRHAPRPGERQLADEVVVHAAVSLAEQHVGNAGALGSRQPGGDEGIASG